MESKINIHIRLDENKMPEQIHWSAPDGGVLEPKESKAFILSLWDKKEESALRIDLWTKHMMVDEMNEFFFQTLMTMADTYQRATNNQNLSSEIKKFAQDLKLKMEISLKEENAI